MTTKLLILDKDGTLVTPASGAQFVQSPEDQMLIPGVAETLARYREKGWAMAIASNQGGVGAGHKTLGSAIEEMAFCLNLAGLLRACFCPDAGDTLWQVRLINGQADTYHRTHSSHECIQMESFRKPGAGMLQWLQVAYGPLDDCLFVGDRPEDQGAATAAGVRFLWASDWLLTPPLFPHDS